MDRLNLKALTSQALADLSAEAVQDERRRAEERALLSLAKAQSLRLLSQLSQLFPVLASSTRDRSGMEVWADAWARQVLYHKLTDAEFATGLQNIALVMNLAGNPPFCFPLFLQACRPAHLTAQDQLARQATLPLLTRDLAKDPAWCAARDAALSKLRAMGYGSPRAKPEPSD